MARVSTPAAEWCSASTRMRSLTLTVAGQSRERRRDRGHGLLLMRQRASCVGMRMPTTTSAPRTPVRRGWQLIRFPLRPTAFWFRFGLRNRHTRQPRHGLAPGARPWRRRRVKRRLSSATAPWPPRLQKKRSNSDHDAGPQCPVPRGLPDCEGAPGFGRCARRHRIQRRAPGAGAPATRQQRCPIERESKPVQVDASTTSRPTHGTGQPATTLCGGTPPRFRQTIDGGQRADMSPRAGGAAVRLLLDAAKRRLIEVMQRLQPSATSRKPTPSAFPVVVGLVP